MEDQTKVKLAAAVVGGYVLGRTKKGRLALTVATYLAGRRFSLEPHRLAAEGMRRLGEVPQFAELQDQLRGEVLDAGRKAVTAAADRGMSSLADAISDRTARLVEPPRDEDEDDAYEDEYEEEEAPDEEGAEEEYEDEDLYEDEEEPADADDSADAYEDEYESEDVAKKPAPARKAARKKPAPAKKAAPKKSAPAKKAAPKKSAPAKKAASAAKKTAADLSSSEKWAAPKRTGRRR